MVQCILPGCKLRSDCRHWKKNTFENKNRHTTPVTFHKIPKDENKRRLYCSILGIDVNRLVDASRVCSTHFSRECFYIKGKKTYLKSDALPSPPTNVENEPRICSKPIQEDNKINLDENILVKDEDATSDCDVDIPENDSTVSNEQSSVQEIATGRSISKMCRLCLACGATISIFRISDKFGKEIADIITKCAPVQIMRNDNKPTSICQLCYNELEKVHQFQMRVVDSDRTLQSYLQHRQFESPPEKQSDDPLSQNSATGVTIKCELPEIEDVVDEALNWTDTVPENYDEANKINQEVLIKSEIKDEPMDDNLSTPTAEYIDDMTDVNGSENSYEDPENQIVDPEVVPDCEYSEDEIDMNCASPEIQELEENVNREMLSAKSKDKYECSYTAYNSWKSANKIKQTSENVLKSYFKIMSKKFKPPTLWTKYFMLKSTIRQKEHINIDKYKSLVPFLKRQSDGYKGKKIKVLSAEEVEKFIDEAPDDKYLATKVALIFGVTGACRREELYNVNMSDVETQGDILIIKIPGSNTKVSRSFTITGKFCDVVKKYASLRPLDIPSNRFFVNFQNGKCTKQVIGINKFGGMPKQIAMYLGLPDPSLYRHSFRRTSTTLPFLKRKFDAYKAKKIKVLSAEEVEKFINEAPDDKYLATKVALIFGVTGACRREELYNVNMNDVEAQGDILLIKIPGSNIKAPRSFTITGKYCDIVKKYASLRPPDIPSNRFFVNFQNGKCTRQVIGINKFGGMPKQIATYLGLPDPALYTGHSFRRTSATLLVNAGADFMTLQHHSNRKSSTIAQGYVEESISNEGKIEQNMIRPDISLNPSIKIEELEMPVSEYM